MKQLQQLLLVCFVALIAASCANQKSLSKEQKYTDLEDSVLWKVEHKSLEEPSYIMGTFHLVCKTDDMIPEKVKTALKEVDELVLELDFDDPAELQAMQTLLLESTPISEELTEEEFVELDKKVKEYTGVPLKMLDPIGLFGLYSFMSLKFLDCPQPVGYELELIEIAKENNQEVEGLETTKEQMDFLKKSMNKEGLMEYFDDIDLQKENFQKALALYQKQEINNIMGVIGGGEEMSQEELDNLLIIRNNNWVEKIPAMIAEDSALIAVGTGHLLEEYGIIHQLRLKGYTITPVF